MAEVERETYNLRVSEQVNVELRSRAMYRGDLTRLVELALRTINLLELDMAGCQVGSSVKQTTIMLPVRQIAWVRSVARQKKCSMTRLVECALRRHLAVQPACAPAGPERTSKA